MGKSKKHVIPYLTGCLECRFDCAPPPITASVSIFYDGSVVVIPGGLEMGQGLHTKVKQVASYELGKLLPENQRPLPMDLLRIGDSRSDIVPNSGDVPSHPSPTLRGSERPYSWGSSALLNDLLALSARWNGLKGLVVVGVRRPQLVEHHLGVHGGGCH